MFVTDIWKVKLQYNAIKMIVKYLKLIVIVTQQKNVHFAKYLSQNACRVFFSHVIEEFARDAISVDEARNITDTHGHITQRSP